MEINGGLMTGSIFDDIPWYLYPVKWIIYAIYFIGDAVDWIKVKLK